MPREKKHWSEELKSQCARYGYGKCTTRACLIRGGHSGPLGLADSSVATCPAFEAVAFFDDLKMLVKWGPVQVNIPVPLVAADADVVAKSKCGFCGDVRPLDANGYCDACIEGMARTGGD